MHDEQFWNVLETAWAAHSDVRERLRRREPLDLSELTGVIFALGGSIMIPTLDGGEEAYEVADGTQSGATIRLSGRGMPDVSGRGRGDLFVTVKVVTPKKLSRDQKKLLEQLAATLPKERFEPTPRQQEDRNIFERVKDIFG